jgi:hypothetical protein
MLVFIAAGILLFIAFLFWWPKYAAQTPASQPRGPMPVHAPAGQLVPGFPKELILDESAKLSDSYSVNYNPSLNQYTAVFNSNEAMLDLFAAYKNWLTRNGWTITNEIAYYPTSRGLYAKKGTADASIAIIDQKTQRQVVVSYVGK